MRTPRVDQSKYQESYISMVHYQMLRYPIQSNKINMGCQQNWRIIIRLLIQQN
ncbi:unnamed protein product [Paramecium octaurelia]|uniref:Uncharacterized protein n=1 Tax=Paramecium octaurelia TaxID=43137 RepID=A0A8S1SIW9_PAROT|nr:unnamed protein product [Paramecium octaurelia]